ncbi:MAG: hypothetical protein OXU45_01355, partial [Candidatus Melainabacteria bacterium]|nr:hypothetical protein [Candidatus Melainabacteria bacterium]
MLCVNGAHSAGQQAYQPHGYIDFNSYYDTRNFQVNTMNAKLDLPGPFSYFGFTNWSGDQTGDDAFDFGEHYTEHGLYYDQVFDSPFDFTVQYADASGFNNDVMRLGAQAHVHKFKYIDQLFKKVNASYWLSYFPWQVDGLDDYAFQLQHVWFMKMLPATVADRLYLSGFADHNFLIGDTPAHNKLVAENQFGYRVWKGLHLVTELRWNGYLPKGDRFGVGIGAQYK